MMYSRKNGDFEWICVVNSWYLPNRAKAKNSAEKDEEKSQMIEIGGVRFLFTISRLTVKVKQGEECGSVSDWPKDKTENLRQTQTNVTTGI